jgi:hypothetical protein
MKAKKTTPTKSTTLARRGRSVPAVTKMATEIRDLIEAARNHVSVTANLAMVSLYWNIGRIITQDIQRNEKRAEYGGQLVEQLSAVLTRDFGRGYSVANLWDMKGFFSCFAILQTVSGESPSHAILQTASGESKVKRICQTASSKLSRREILQTPSAELVSLEKGQTLSAESSERILINFREHFRLG